MKIQTLLGHRLLVQRKVYSPDGREVIIIPTAVEQKMENRDPSFDAEILMLGTGVVRAREEAIEKGNPFPNLVVGGVIVVDNLRGTVRLPDGSEIISMRDVLLTKERPAAPLAPLHGMPEKDFSDKIMCEKRRLPDTLDLIHPVILHEVRATGKGGFDIPLWLQPADINTPDDARRLLNSAAWGKALPNQTLEHYLSLERVYQWTRHYLPRANMIGLYEMIEHFPGNFSEGDEGSAFLIRVNVAGEPCSLWAVWADSIGAAKRFVRKVAREVDLPRMYDMVGSDWNTNPEWLRDLTPGPGE